MFQMNVPKLLWGDAVHTVAFLINLLPSFVLKGQIPYSVLCPSRSLFPIPPKIFGCTCFVQDVKPRVSKLDPRALKCVFLGYSRTQRRDISVILPI